MSRIYNYTFQKQDTRDLKLVHPTTRVVLPPSFDLRTKFTEPIVFDQKSVGSCTANASALAYMFHLIKQKIPVFTPSRLFIYANSRILQGTPLSEDSGADLRLVMSAIKNQHVCPENVWPYIEAKFSVKPSAAAYAAATKHKAFQYLAVSQTSNDIKKTLLSGDAIVFGFQVYESFESDAVAKTGIVPIPDTTKEQYLGGHAVTLIGWDDSKKAFLVQNSWGEDTFGLKGCCWMPYEFILSPELASDFWCMKLVS